MNFNRIVNIALVGHVANGKTTLVQKLSGVCTKRESTEKKTGRTIKLGYANCVIHKCEICNNIITTGQEYKINPICCGFETINIRNISFVDAPGHHSYIQTMIKGSTIVDCAIIVTDVRANTLQAQTLEHLAILYVLNIENIIVVQNKVDLVGDRECKENYEMLKKELSRTIAENAPIIPISAQTGLGISYLQKYIYEMTEKCTSFAANIKSAMSIIRSFDVNLPNLFSSSALIKKGGVLGVSIKGNAKYSIGEEIEIRPGINGKILKTTIVNIMSEKISYKEISQGGLYGIETTLDSSLTKQDGLVGNIAGRANELPEIVSSLTMKVTKCNLNSSDYIKFDKGTYTLIIGNVVVDCVAKKNLNGSWTMNLAKPICTIERKCLIYKNKVLIAFGVLDFLNPILIKKIKSYFQPNSYYQDLIFSSNVFTNSDIEEILAFPCQTKNGTIGEILGNKILGQDMLNYIFGNRTNNKFIQNENDYIKILSGKEKQTKEKTHLPVPIVKRENKNAIWYNANIFCKTIDRDPSQVFLYISKEMCLNVSPCADGLRLFNIKIDEKKMQKILVKYVREFVSCKECKSINTFLVKEYKIKSLSCRDCNSIRPC